MKKALALISILSCSLIVLVTYQNCAQKGFETGLEGSSSTNKPTSTGTNTQAPDSKMGINCEISANPAPLLSQTCLKTENKAVNTFKNLRYFNPQYPLYSDGASKGRWIYLPPGTQINTVDPDNWIFPTGTILWKEFSLDGQKIETRQIEKIGDGTGADAWRFSVYAWRADQSDADLIDDLFHSPENAENIEKYTIHSFKDRYQMVTSNQCLSCHAGAKDIVLGFNYLQLSSKNVALSLDRLNKNDLLSHPLAKYDEIPGSDVDKKAIGYLQSNCATCHNGELAPNNFRHLSTAKSLREENVFLAIAANPDLVKAKKPGESLLYTRFFSGAMPPRSQVPLKKIDIQGINALAEWINAQ